MCSWECCLKKFVYRLQEDASNIKIRSSFGFSWLFFLFLEGVWGFICTFSKGPNLLMKFLCRSGAAGQRFLNDSLGERTLGPGGSSWSAAYAFPCASVYCKTAIAQDGEPSNERKEAQGARSALSTLVQVLLYFVYSQRVFLIFR